MVPYLIVLIVAAGVSYAVTPSVIWFTKKVNAVAVPNDRTVHSSPTPTLGGISIFIAFLFSFALASVMTPFSESFGPVLVWPPSEAIGIAGALAVIFALGVVDDLKGLNAPSKFAVQVLAAGLVFLSGVRLSFFRVPFGTDALSLSGDVSAIVTILWIVVMVNAVNLIDGLDGLAAGIAAIAAGTFFVYAFTVSEGVSGGLQQNAPLISVIIVGAALGFLRYNFHPAKVFMGDSGSYTLGFLLAVSTVIGVGRTIQNPRAESLLFYLPIIIPLMVLAIPILDTFLAVVRRARKGVHLFQADKEHLHHRLLELGHGHRQAVLVMYAWGLIVAGFTLSIQFVPSTAVRLSFIAAGIALLLYSVIPELFRRT